MKTDTKNKMTGMDSKLNPYVTNKILMLNTDTDINLSEMKTILTKDMNSK